MKTWKEVQESEEYRALSPQEQEQARGQYFESVVSPNVLEPYRDEARRQFDDATGGAVSQEAMQQETGQQEASVTHDPLENPLAGNSALHNLFIGAGATLTDMGLAARQLVGMATPDEAREKKERDAYIQKEWAGVLGNLLVQMGFLGIPAIGAVKAASGAAKAMKLVKTADAAKSAVGAGAIGGAVGGALTPETEEGQRLGMNVPLGTLLGGGLSGALSVGAKTVRNIGAPAAATVADKVGQWNMLPERTRDMLAAFAQTYGNVGSPAERKAADMINRLHGFSNDLKKPHDPGLPGTPWSVAVRYNDPVLMEIQNALARNPVSGMTQILDKMQGMRDAVRRDFIEKIAGTPEDLTAAIKERKRVTGPLYRAAFDGEKPRITEGMARELEEKYRSLFSRPIMHDAMNQARIYARNEGGFVDYNRMPPLEQMHYMKLWLDGEIKRTASQTGGTSGHDLRQLMNTKRDLLDYMTALSPKGYKMAMDKYESMSRPINQMEIGQALKDNLFPAIGTELKTPDAFLRSLRGGLDEGDKRLVEKVTGMSLDMDQVLTPQQIKGLRGMLADLNHEHAANKLSAAMAKNAVGEATPQQQMTASLLVGAARNAAARALGMHGAATIWHTLGDLKRFLAGGMDDASLQEMSRILTDPSKFTKVREQQLAKMARSNAPVDAPFAPLGAVISQQTQPE